MKNLKLNSLASKRLSETQMNGIKGGDCSCGCGCLYANSGGQVQTLMQMQTDRVVIFLNIIR